MKKLILILITIGLVLPIFSFARINVEVIKEKTPGILSGWWNSIKTFFGRAKDLFLNAFVKVWQGTVALWQKMWLWIKNTWESYISLKIDLMAEKIKGKLR